MKIHTSAMLWLVISIIQLIIGIFLYWPAAIFGVLNLICSITRFKLSSKVLKPYPLLIEEFRKWLAPLIIALILNIVCSAIIGVVGYIYDSTVRQFP